MIHLTEDPEELDKKLSFSPYSIENDAFDIRAFEEIKIRSVNLLKTEEKGSADYPPFPELMQDTFDGLYKYDPELLPESQIKRDYLLNHKVMSELTEAQRFKELRVMTQLDDVNAAIGTELMSEEMQAYVQNELKKEREALEKLKAAGDEMDKAAEEAGEEGEGGAGVGTGEGKGGEGKGLSKKKFTLEEAKKKYEEAMKNFQQATTRDEFKHSISRVAAKVRDSVRETNDLITNWGLGASGSFMRKSPHEKIELLNRIRSSAKLKKIADLAGRFRQLISTMEHEKIKYGLDETYSIMQGNSIEHLITSELMRYMHPKTKRQFLLDLIEGKTLQYQIRGKEKKGKGPIVICLDSSGSMEGPPEVWSKAVALMLLEFAQKSVPKRDFYCVHFSSGYRGKDLHVNEFPKDKDFNPEEVLAMAEYFEAGGTEFEPPLNLAREKIGNDPIYKKSDIIFVTDGQSVVSDEWLIPFKKWKEENNVKIYSILIDSWDNSTSTLDQFSDSISKLSNLKTNQEDIALSIFTDI
jgi:uncharacterized protein with von Willebrand factor type A (vWA) domain